MKIRKAKVQDIPEIHKIINGYAKKNLMLPRSLSELYESVQEFFVVEVNKKIVGCCALHVTWEDLGEIRSIAVKREYQNRNYGAKLLAACHKQAKNLGLKKVFTLTVIPEYFKKFGYKEIPKEKLPHKVWSDCIKCPLFPDCNEIPLVKLLE